MPSSRRPGGRRRVSSGGRREAVQLRLAREVQEALLPPPWQTRSSAGCGDGVAPRATP